MKFCKRIRVLLLGLLMVLASAFQVRAAPTPSVEEIIRQMIGYYLTYQEKAQTDITRLVCDLTGISEAQGDVWGKIMDYWSYANTDMEIPTEVLPDGLPEDDSLCIVVLGYQLGPYGIIKPELAGRLEVALASAKKYPNAFILCTGGATASGSKSKTEAGQMASWLKNRGISEDRIILETRAYSTVSNATNSCKILSADYPQVQHLALISSDYHLPRGCVYFYTQSQLSAYRQGTPTLDIVGCAAYPTNRNASKDIATQAEGIAQLAGISGYQSVKPSLSRLTGITLDGLFTYEAGNAMFITVEASYDTGVTRDVTVDAVFSGVDMNVPGEQLLQVSYTENGTTATAEALIDVIGMPLLESDTILPPIAEAAEDALVPVAAGTPAPLWPFLVITALLALLILLLRIKYHHQ